MMFIYDGGDGDEDQPVQLTSDLRFLNLPLEPSSPNHQMVILSQYVELSEPKILPELITAMICINRKPFQKLSKVRSSAEKLRLQQYHQRGGQS